MVIITRYRKERDEKGLVHIVSEEICICPICAERLKVAGVRKRELINNAGDKETLVIRRLRCDVCGKIHHELPDMVIPYKRHCAETIENIAVGKVEDVCCDFMTEKRIRAWWLAFCLYFENIKESLRMKFGIAFSANATPREIVRAVANANLWVHTRTAKTRT